LRIAHRGHHPLSLAKKKQNMFQKLKPMSGAMVYVIRQRSIIVRMLGATQKQLISDRSTARDQDSGIVISSSAGAVSTYMSPIRWQATGMFPRLLPSGKAS
jgi:hypothetical protein